MKTADCEMSIRNTTTKKNDKLNECQQIVVCLYEWDSTFTPTLVNQFSLTANTNASMWTNGQTTKQTRHLFMC